MNVYFNNKDKNKLIVTNMIDDNEKEDLLNFIEKSSESIINTSKTYDLDGNISGLVFELGEGINIDRTPLSKYIVDTSDGTALPEDIAEGKIAYSQGKKLIGINKLAETTAELSKQIEELTNQKKQLELELLNSSKDKQLLEQQITELNNQITVRNDLIYQIDNISHDMTIYSTEWIKPTDEDINVTAERIIHELTDTKIFVLKYKDIIQSQYSGLITDITNLIMSLEENLILTPEGIQQQLVNPQIDIINPDLPKEQTAEFQRVIDNFDYIKHIKSEIGHALQDATYMSEHQLTDEDLKQFINYSEYIHNLPIYIIFNSEEELKAYIPKYFNIRALIEDDNHNIIKVFEYQNNEWIQISEEYGLPEGFVPMYVTENKDDLPADVPFDVALGFVGYVEGDYSLADFYTWSNTEKRWDFTNTSVNSEGTTAIDSDLASGKTAFSNNKLITGTLQEVTSVSSPVSNTTMKKHNFSPIIYQVIGTNINSTNKLLKANSSATLDIYDSNIAEAIRLTADKILAGITVLGIDGTATSDADAVPANIMWGKTAYVNGQKITGTLSSINSISDGFTYTQEEPFVENEGTTELLIGARFSNDASHVYLFNNTQVNIKVPKSQMANRIGLTADKIKSGETILNIEGTFTYDADAVARDIVKGKTAYVNGQKITGNLDTAGSLNFRNNFNITQSTNTINVRSNYSPTSADPDVAIIDANTNVFMNVPLETLASAIGLTADKIKAGVTILGITGTYTGE